MILVPAVQEKNTSIAAAVKKETLLLRVKNTALSANYVCNAVCAFPLRRVSFLH